MGFEIPQSVRLAKLDLRRDIKTGRLKAADVILDPPSYILNTTTIYHFVMWQKNWGHRRAVKLGNGTNVNLHKLIRDTTERERKVISEWLIKNPFPYVSD